MKKKYCDSVAFRVFEKVRLIGKLCANGNIVIDETLRAVSLSPELFVTFESRECGLENLMESVQFYLATAHAVRMAEALKKGEIPDRDSEAYEKEIAPLIAEIKPVTFVVVGESDELLARGVYDSGKLIRF